MAKTGPQRAAAYRAKIDADVVKTRITARMEAMKDAQDGEQANLATLAGQVKAICDGQTVSSIMQGMYIAYGNQLYGLQKKHGLGTNTFETEAGYAHTTWVARGLLEAPLAEIDSLFGIYS